ncbi:putative signal peptide protein [Puccinia sorghi]|uniref:Putative signal peptide protein n=1 Tax=Puccinia sorghi TaxID=27349 RepID=A0A0L6V237_9BASI|nr:putative signal peptide protein [Puccinia sorghi]
MRLPKTAYVVLSLLLLRSSPCSPENILCQCGNPQSVEGNVATKPK